MNGKEKEEEKLMETKMKLKLELIQKVLSAIKKGERVNINLTADDPTSLWI